MPLIQLSGLQPSRLNLHQFEVLPLLFHFLHFELLLSFDLLAYNFHVGAGVAGVPIFKAGVGCRYDGVIIVHIDADSGVGLASLLLGDPFEKFLLVHFD